MILHNGESKAHVSQKEMLDVWSVKDYLKHGFMVAIKIPIWLAQYVLYWVPPKHDRIVIYSLKQHGYSCNLKYFTEYLRQQQSMLDILWVVRREEDYRQLQALGVSAALLHSWKHAKYRFSAKLIITNDEFYPLFVKRAGQILLNMWHGGINYKKIGYDGLAFTNALQRMIYRMKNPCPDYFISGSRKFTETTAKSFRFPETIFVPSGLPRNDVLFHGCDKVTASLREKLGIPKENKIVLYAPTFRKGMLGQNGCLDYHRLTEALQNRFGGQWTLLLRQHYFVESKDTALPSFCLDVSRYPDMQELLLCSDCLISDYSSCMWDYLILERPCFVFAPDLESYQESDRSFFIPVEQWPYPISTSMDGLVESISCFEENHYLKSIRQHKRACGSYDSGTACEQICRLVTALTQKTERNLFKERL